MPRSNLQVMLYELRAMIKAEKDPDRKLKAIALCAKLDAKKPKRKPRRAKVNTELAHFYSPKAKEILDKLT